MLMIIKHVYNFTNAVPVATKFGRLVTYLEGLLSILSPDSLVMWPS